MSLNVFSTAFESEQTIPAQYTCDGDDISPPLSWMLGPPGTKGYALIMDDPDAPLGTWVHWLAWNIHDTKLAENGAKKGEGFVQGTNSWKRRGYGGPCPPPGSHRYYFKLFALDDDLDARPETTKQDLLEAMDGHVLAEGVLMGRYARK